MSLLVWLPYGKTLDLDNLAVDAIYITRPQVERWTVKELLACPNLEAARVELKEREAGGQKT